MHVPNALHTLNQWRKGFFSYPIHLCIRVGVQHIVHHRQALHHIAQRREANDQNL